MTTPPPAATDKSKAACDYMNSLTDLTTKFKTAVGCTGAGAPPAPVITTLTEPDIKSWLKTKAAIKGNEFLDGAIVAKDNNPGKTDEFTITAKNGKTFNIQENFGLDATADEIAVALSGTPTQTMVMAGGRRGKRSARRGRRSFKSGRRSRRSRKGGRRSRGCKGRKSRGRSNKSKGGAKMGKELKAWMKRQQKATGIPPISKATIAATKTNPQSTGSAQRSESSKHVAAQSRGLNSSSS